MNTKLKKAAVFTDIHWGARLNSIQHNEDCLKFIDWFIKQINEDGEIDHIIFMGDWFESRSSIDIATLQMSLKGAERLNSVGLPIYMIVGNHDLYHKHSRNIHSINAIAPLSNFILINDIQIRDEIYGRALFSPFLFNDEYNKLLNFTDVPVWWGHFEFKGFIVTGYTNYRLPTGISADTFKGPKRIFSGHFHKRQTQDIVTFIGNALPSSFSDANDYDRGMMIYDYVNDSATFINWDGPKYQTITLSELLNDEVILFNESRVKCYTDVPLSYDECLVLKRQYMSTFNLREFTLEEPENVNELSSDTNIAELSDICEESDDINDRVVKLLELIEIPKNKEISIQKLKNIYQSLSIEGQ